MPHPHNSLDKQLAATALAYGLTLVTRNVNDFVGTGVPLINRVLGINASDRSNYPVATGWERELLVQVLQMIRTQS